MPLLGSDIPRFPRPDDSSPTREQCDYMDAIDRQAKQSELESLRIVRFRVQQAISEARKGLDAKDADEIVGHLEAALNDADLDCRIVRAEEELAS